MAFTNRDQINSAMGSSQDPNQDDYQTSMGAGQYTAGGPPPPVPTVLSQPTVSPSSAQQGSTFTATPGTYSNTSSVSRSWLLSGSAISSGLSAIPGSAGTLTYQETATGPGGSVQSNVISAVVTAAPVPPSTISAPQLTRTSAAGTNPIAFDTFLPVDIDHTVNVLRGQLSSDPSFPAGNTTTEVVPLDENMVEGQYAPFNFLTPPMPTGANYIRVREENATGSVASPYSNTIMDTLPGAVNNGFNDPSPLYSLSNGNKVATRDSTATSGIARAPKGIASGAERYFEFTYRISSGGYGMIGLTSDATLAGDGETSGADRFAWKSEGVTFKDGAFQGGGFGQVGDTQTGGLYYNPDTNEVRLSDSNGGTRGPYAWDKAIAMYPFAFVRNGGDSVTINLTGPFIFNERGAQAWNA